MNEAPALRDDKRTRLAVVVSHPTQYYGPWFRRLAAEPSLELRVFYLWDFGVAGRHDRQFGRTVKWDVDLLSGYAHEFVPNEARDPGTHRFGGLHNPSLRGRLRAWSPDAVLLFGYAYRTHLGLLLNPPAPLVFRGDSHLIGQPRPSLVKRLALRWVYSRCAAVTYVGRANHHYFRTFGVPEAKLHFAPHAVDATRFARDATVTTAAGKLLADLGLTGKTIILFAGKLLPAKQPLELLEAFQKIAPADAALVFVGEGSERERLETLAARRPDQSVRFLPFANQSEMPVRYAMADLFVLPSRGLYETWGLAVNEAMHLGVPCLVSDRVGCQLDLVTNRETGWVFDASVAGALPDALQGALADIASRADAIRGNVSQHIARYTYEAATAGLLSALRALKPRVSV